MAAASLSPLSPNINEDMETSEKEAELLRAPFSDLRHRLGQMQSAMENLQSSQSCQSILLEEVRSLILEVKASTQRRRTPPTPPEPPFPLPIPNSPDIPDEGPSPTSPKRSQSAVDSKPQNKKHAHSTLAKVSEELSDILSGKGSAGVVRPRLLSGEEEKSGDDARVKSKPKGKARSILGLVLPQGPSLVDPLAAASVEDLEAHTAYQLLKRDMSSPSKSPRDSARQEEEEGPKVAEKWINSYREEPERERMNEPNEDPSEFFESSVAASSRSETPIRRQVDIVSPKKVKTITLGRMSSSERNEILNKGGPRGSHIALGDLQMAHDEKARSLAHSNTGSKGFAEFIHTLEPFEPPMPLLGRVWLTCMGVLDLLGSSCLQYLRGIWILCLFVGLLVLGGFMMWQSFSDFMELLTTITTACYMVGVLAGIWSLRRAGIQELLGSHDGSLEAYAHLQGFVKAWKIISRRRLREVLGFMLLMIACRTSVHLPITGFEQEGDHLERTIAFCFAAVGFAAIAFTQLHVVAGLELAIDNFSVKFFKLMDLAMAIQEWNVVQATLRQVSMRLSASLLLLGSSCGVSLLLLLELAFLRTEQERGKLSNAQLLLFIAWLVPPLLLFLYVLMRAASVTEKASRVAPLVNSWQFDRRKSVVYGVNWMDYGRQYMVQYIMQSEAGFYLQGKRLYTFQVTKLCYYLMAFSTAMLSRFG